MDIHQLKQRIDASGKKPRPITDQCALTVLVWVHQNEDDNDFYRDGYLELGGELNIYFLSPPAHTLPVLLSW